MNSGQRSVAWRPRRVPSGPATVLIYVLWSAISLFLVIFAALQLPAAIRAGSGQGVRGYFTAAYEEKGSWYGTFRLPSGKVLIGNVEYYDPPAVHAGATVPGLYSGGTPAAIYPVHGSQEWKGDIGTIVGAFILFAGAQAYGVVSLIRVRRARAWRGSV